ncbi:MAG: T9SS C-terminal target domain-containing protein [Ignavibacteriales bacterium]|nr:MAG: T9SS C-terminal target domain-containing protein [Ignavibacteriales bacterium]
MARNKLLPGYSYKKILKAIFFIILFSSFASPIFSQDFMMQGWYWDYPKATDSFNWADNLSGKAADLKASGFTYIWLPPFCRASSGNNSNGYDPKDLYDLGEYGKGATGFGTRTDINELITAFNSQGLKAVADVVYNHRDGGVAEDNFALKTYIANYDWTRANTGYSPYPYDRMRCYILLGGASGNGAGDYYFKISSASGHTKFKDYQYSIYIQTKTIGWKGLSDLTESEPNGGGDCDPDQVNNNIELGRNMNSTIDDPAGCRTDEYKLTLSASDFNSAGDTLFIYFGKRSSDYSDARVYGIWSGPLSLNIIDELKYQTYTDFTHMPSDQGEMTFANFKPNETNSTKLDGDWDWPWFFYDYDQNVTDTKDKLFAWTNWLWSNVGIRGLRMDAVKHFPYQFVGDILDYLHDNTIDPGLVVGEFYDANTSALKSWIDNVYANMDADTKAAITPRIFDFSLRSALEQACDTYGYDVRNVFNASLVDAAGVSGYNVVTFINNHDFRDAGQMVDNNPILAYAYILTNNQVGLPCVFYPDYFNVSGFTNTNLKSQIDALISVHKQYIAGATSREYLSRFSTNRYIYFNDLTDHSSTTLIYQLWGTPSGKDVIVAINFAGVALDCWIGVNTATISEGTTLGDKIGNATLSTLTVSGGRVNVKLPARSYAVFVEGEAPLPVELISFNGKLENEKVILNWQTATEVNNYGFNVERRTKSKEWSTIGFVNGYGNSNSPKSYSFIDNPEASPKYDQFVYRLKQIDTDGSFTYSNEIIIKINDKPGEFLLCQNYPNPFNPLTNIEFTLPEAGLVKIGVFNVLGEQIELLKNNTEEKGKHIIEWNAQNYSSGIYFCKIEYTSPSSSKMKILKMLLSK